MFIRDDFPAPDGPITAVSSPELNLPEIPLRMSLRPEKTQKENKIVCLFLFVFVALRPMSTAMVIAGRSVHLTTLFPGQA